MRSKPHPRDAKLRVSKDGPVEAGQHCLKRLRDAPSALLRTRSVRWRWQFRASLPLRPPVDRVSALLESAGEFAERGVEHRTHQHTEGPALEFVVDEEADARALPFSLVLEGPDVFEPAERPVDIFHPQFEVRLVECDPARKGLANELVTDGHVGDEGLASVRLRPAAADPKPLA